jgi:chromosome segregation ATPase
MKFPFFSRDSWLIAIMGVIFIALGFGIGYYFHFVQTSSSPQSPNSPAPATSPSASPSSKASSSPTSPPAPELPLLDELQSNLPMLNSKLDAVIKALDGVKIEQTPEQLRLAWTNVDAQVDQLCTSTVYPLKKQIEQQSNNDKTYETIVDLFNQIGETCKNINLDTDRLKANNQPYSDTQQTVDSPETKIRQELQNIKQLLNQVKEWVGQEQEKKYREGLDKRLEFQQNLQYSILGLLLVLLITVVLYKKGDRTVARQELERIQSVLTEVEQQRTISSSVSKYNNEDKNYDNFIQELTKKILEGITPYIENKNKFNSSESSFLGNTKNQHNSESSLSTDFSDFSNNFYASQQQVQNQISNLSQEITHINSTLSTILTQLTQLNDNSTATSAQTEDDAQYDPQQLNSVPNDNEIPQNTEVEELRSQLEQVQNDLKTAKDSVQQLEQKLESEQSKAQANIQQLNITLQAEQETICQLQSDLQEKQNRLATLEQQIEIKDSTINPLQSEKRNAKPKNEAEETNNKPNKTQGTSQELQSLVDQYNQSKGDLAVWKVSSFTPVKDASERGSSVIKVKKADESQARFYIISCRQELYLFPKLKILSSADKQGFDRYFDCPTWNGSTIDIQLVTPPKMKPISGTKDNWELVDKYSKGKVT